MICFEKNALCKNIPNEKTIISKDHKIFYNGQWSPADRFLNYSNKVTKVKYSGEILYNVLLANHGRINVNNITCETLHPENVIAKLYQSNLSESYKNKLVAVMNNSLLERDIQAYKRIINIFN